MKIQRMLRPGAALALALAVLLLAGCAKKSRETAPVPTPTPQPPSTVVPEKPTEAPKPAETTPPVTTVRSEDLQPAFFDFDSYALSDAARAALDQDARLLRDRAGVKITIEGHCDERGTAEYNQALGERRAQAARDYVVAAGVDAARIQVISYGKERPFDSGQEEAAWAKNRRAHFVVR